MAIPPFVSVPIAGVIPFDNTTNGYISDNVQQAIEESKFNEDILLTDQFFDVLVDNEGNILRGL